MFSYVYNFIPYADRNQGHGKVFVAQNYSDAKRADFRSAVQQAFEPELTSYHADTELTPDHLLVKLARRIEVSRLFIGDLTSATSNVMVEIGIALGRNKQVLLCCQEQAQEPEFLWEIGVLRYRDYHKHLRSLLEQQKHGGDFLTLPHGEVCQLCRRFCEGRRINHHESNHCLIVDGSPVVGHQEDFLEVVKNSLSSVGLQGYSLGEMQKPLIRNLCTFVYAIQSSRLTFFRFAKGMDLLVPFLFGLSYGLQVYPVILNQGEPIAIPTDLAGHDRVDFSSYQQLSVELDQKLPSLLKQLKLAEIPLNWAKFDSKTIEALVQLKGFLEQWRRFSVTTINVDLINNDSKQQFENALEIALTLALYAVKASAGSIMLISPDETLKIIAMVAPRIEMEAKGEWREFAIDEGICGMVVKERKTYLTGNVSDDLYYAKKTFDKDLQSLLCAPIINDGYVLGVLNVDSREPDFFRPEDAEILEQVTEMLGGFIESWRPPTEPNIEDIDKTQVSDQLVKDTVCLNCGATDIFLGFKRMNDDNGLRLLMFSKCTNCSMQEDIRSYYLYTI